MATPDTLPISSIWAARYLPATAASVLVWDHILTIEREVRYIWFNKGIRLRSQLLFAMNRYATTVMIIYMAYVFSGSNHVHLSDSRYDSRSSMWNISSFRFSCRTFIWFFASFSAIFVSISHFIIILRIYTLWDKRRKVAYILVGAFFTAISITTAFTVLTAHDLQPYMHFNALLHTCAVGGNYVPRALSVALGSTSLFDLFIVVMVTFNVLDRPRTFQVKVLHELQRDGFRMFLGLFLLRLADLLMSLLGNSSNFYVLLSYVSLS
ncbi:hypothetical protein BDQ17DRAFT_1429611 [Cyathus striatus]|nr:hypothetical protein BDQ17DRAFT_1429611 [Cyathus striatus]